MLWVNVCMHPAATSLAKHDRGEAQANYTFVKSLDLSWFSDSDDDVVVRETKLQYLRDSRGVFSLKNLRVSNR